MQRLEATESLVHLAKLRHSIRLAQTWLPGVMQDGAGEMEAVAGSRGMVNTEPPPLATAQLVPRLLKACLGWGVGAGRCESGPLGPIPTSAPSLRATPVCGAAGCQLGCLSARGSLSSCDTCHIRERSKQLCFGKTSCAACLFFGV